MKCDVCKENDGDFDKKFNDCKGGHTFKICETCNDDVTSCPACYPPGSEKSKVHEEEKKQSVSKLSKIFLFFTPDHAFEYAPGSSDEDWKLLQIENFPSDTFIFPENSSAAYLHSGSSQYVLLTGGLTAPPNLKFGTNECYFVRINTDNLMDVTTAPPLNEGRHLHQTIAIGSNIYAIGGKRDKVWLNSCEKFNSHSNKWEKIKPMLNKRAQFGACVVGNKIVVYGGFEDQNETVAKIPVEVYDTEKDTWSEVMVKEGYSLAGSTIVKGPEESVFVIGGSDGEQLFDGFFKIDLTLGEIEYFESLPTPTAHAHTFIHDNELYVIGGVLSQDQCHKYNFIKGEWLDSIRSYRNVVERMQTAEDKSNDVDIAWKASVNFGNEDITSLAPWRSVGLNITANINKVDKACIILDERPLVFDFSDETWSLGLSIKCAGKTDFSILENSDTVTLPSKKQSVVTGGLKESTGTEASQNNGSEQTFLLTKEADGSIKAEELASMNQPRYLHSSVISHDEEKVYVLGGLHQKAWLNTCEVLDLKDNKWTQLPPMSHDRSQFTATLLNNKIYVFGGFSDHNVLASSIECFDIVSAKWSTIDCKEDAQLLVGSRSFVATDSSILISGGSDGNQLYSAIYSFDVNTNQIKEIHRLPIPLAHFHAFLTPKFLYVMGGIGSQGACHKLELGKKSSWKEIRGYTDLLRDVGDDSLEVELWWKTSLLL